MLSSVALDGDSLVSFPATAGCVVTAFHVYKDKLCCSEVLIISSRYWMTNSESYEAPKVFHNVPSHAIISSGTV